MDLRELHKIYYRKNKVMPLFNYASYHANIDQPKGEDRSKNFIPGISFPKLNFRKVRKQKIGRNSTTAE